MDGEYKWRWNAASSVDFKCCLCVRLVSLSNEEEFRIPSFVWVWELNTLFPWETNIYSQHVLRTLYLRYVVSVSFIIHSEHYHLISFTLVYTRTIRYHAFCPNIIRRICIFKWWYLPVIWVLFQLDSSDGANYDAINTWRRSTASRDRSPMHWNTRVSTA